MAAANQTTMLNECMPVKCECSCSEGWRSHRVLAISTGSNELYKVSLLTLRGLEEGVCNGSRTRSAVLGGEMSLLGFAASCQWTTLTWAPAQYFQIVSLAWYKGYSTTRLACLKAFNEHRETPSDGEFAGVDGRHFSRPSGGLGSRNAHTDVI